MVRSRGNNPTHDIIVVGASAGGVEALTTLVRGLPADLPAALFIVLHIPPYSESHLPAILAHRGRSPRRTRRTARPLRPGASTSRRRTTICSCGTAMWS
jgi:two-component system, chemotaxis family, protein-glutamate methylesterase/glutaminase